ncbi:hypothetical protein DL96DRAFT_1625852 [Flagelloscypha sp. PMI_526]|nr:hypothetical protein DL96DRAFT_1625852 [Flagelloscypha sp. PMI_526]
MPASVQNVAELYNDVADIAYFYNLETFVISLCYGECHISHRSYTKKTMKNLGPVLILSITALTYIRRRRPATRSLKWLFAIILIQIILVTLRFVCQIGENLVAFKQTRFLFIGENGVKKAHNVKVTTLRLAMNTIGDFSSRVVEALANGVVVWRAWSLYFGVLRIKYFLIVAWICDLVIGMAYFGVSVGVTFKWLSQDDSQHVLLTYVTMYSSRWTSFALNLVATLLIGYRTWKLRGTLNNAGFSLKRSSVYAILARLVEAGVILLAVQLLVAVLAVTYTSGNPADSGFIALGVLVDIAFMIINAHPAGMALVTEHVWAREQQDAGDVETNGQAISAPFRAGSNSTAILSLDSPGTSGSLNYLEK